MKLSKNERRLLDLATSSTLPSGEIRILAAAITFAEMQFRPLWWRTAEFSLALVRYALGLSIAHLTLGISQISVRHVLNKHKQSEFWAIKSLSSPQFSFELCCELLSENGKQEIGEQIRFYNGNASTFYKRLVHISFDRFSSFVKYQIAVDD